VTKRSKILKGVKLTLTVNKEQEKKPKKQKLRNSEYYNIQSTLDRLHTKATEGKVFNNLFDMIVDENNIRMAYRNIKKNGGSKTKGTDGKTIEDYKCWSEKEFVMNFQNKLADYKPKSVRRVEIPKAGQPHKTRPLGIPCMDDRIIQQCILQILEPICEAHFHKHSYGFRPNRATSHAIARANSLMNINGLHYVVDIDIKGFFDNVVHGKLLKQMWTMGIQDKNVLSIISKILKAEIEGIGKPTKGTPQGGIISPLLSNIVLNELDWWISGQWETFQTEHRFSRNNSKMTALKKSSKMKEIFLVRYADDFKIFCRDYKTATRIFVATKAWLMERLGLEISPEKSKITNVRKGKTEFLGLTLYTKNKGKKTVAKSNITEKAKQTMIEKLKEQVKKIKRNTTAQQVNRLNAVIIGMHNYYQMATRCNIDFSEINFIVSKSLDNRLKGVTKTVRGKKRNKKPPDQEPKQSNARTYEKFYGKYKGKTRTIAKIRIFPIYGCTFKPPMCFSQEINSYTENGRKLIHGKLSNMNHLVEYLLNSKEYDKSVEYNDNRISLMAGQNGKCGVTGKPLEPLNMECHHKRPKHLGGSDEYKNLLWVMPDVHELIHATQSETIAKYLKRLNLDKTALKKVNSLRLLAENLEIETEN